MKARELKQGDLFKLVHAGSLPESLAARFAATVWMVVGPSKYVVPQFPTDVMAVAATGNVLFLRDTTEVYVVRVLATNPTFAKLYASPDRETAAIRALIDDLATFDGTHGAETGTSEHLGALTKAVIWLLTRARTK